MVKKRLIMPPNKSKAIRDYWFPCGLITVLSLQPPYADPYRQVELLAPGMILKAFIFEFASS